MQGVKVQGSAEKKSAEEAGLQVLLDRCCYVLAEAVDDACSSIFAFEGRSVCCCLQGECYHWLSNACCPCLMSTLDACRTWNVCSAALGSQFCARPVH